MKEVKNEMICAISVENNETKVKISKPMVKMVTLLLPFRFCNLEYMDYQVPDNESDGNFTIEEAGQWWLWMEPLRLVGVLGVHDPGVRLWHVCGLFKKEKDQMVVQNVDCLCED